MKIEELEIENFKCLNNKGMPLKFSNLNILIGENDSGKTSLLEIIEIMFKQKEIKKAMFFDLSRDVSVKVKFNDIKKEIIKENFRFQQLKINSNEYLEILNKGSDPYLEMCEIKKDINLIGFEEILTFLSDFSFYKDLKLFFNNFINPAFITGKLLFRADTPDENSLEAVNIRNNSVAFFDFDNNSNKILNNILKKEEFINFIFSYNKKFNNYITEFYNNFINAGVPPRFVDDYSFLINNTIFLSSEDDTLLKLFKRLYAQKIFLDDSEELVISKIAGFLSNFINKRNSSASWESDCSIQLGGYWQEGSDICTLRIDDDWNAKLSEELKFYEHKNLFSNFTIEDHYPEEELAYLPKVKIFRSEVINKEVPYKLFDDIYGGIDKLKFYIKRNVAGYLEELNKKISFEYFDVEKFQDRNNMVFQIMKEFGENIENIKIDMKIDYEYENLDPNYYFFDYLKKEYDELLKPKINFILKQNNQEINLSQKSQGFLRKILLADFLLLISKGNDDKNIVKDIEKPIIIKIEESPNEGNLAQEKTGIDNMIILIEEPELHLHYGAQKKIMKLIKEKLSNSENQVFITTHSHFIIEDGSFENIYVFKKNSNTRISEINNISNFSTNNEILEKLQSSLSLKKTDLLFLKKLIVIMEGKNDIAFIKGICKKQEYGINVEEILFIEAKGQANINYYIGLGDFLKIKVLVIFDNHPENFKTKNRILANPYKSTELTESIMKLEVLDKPDILNYLDIRTVENYFNLPKNSIDLKNNNLKDILYSKGKYINTDDVEFLASQIPKIDKELENKIINIIKLFKVF